MKHREDEFKIAFSGFLAPAESETQKTITSEQNAWIKSIGEQMDGSASAFGRAKALTEAADAGMNNM